MVTANKSSLAFSINEISEFKKTSRGVKGITLAAGDKLIFADCADSQTETLDYNGKPVNIKKIRTRHRGNKGQKATGVI
jgi:DNA gyrase subunit A